MKSIDLHVGSSDTDLATAHLDMDLPAGKLVDTTFVVSGLQASATLANTLFIGIDKVNGEPDENPSNDNVSLPFANERIVLLEEFTSEGNVNAATTPITPSAVYDALHMHVSECGVGTLLVVRNDAVLKTNSKDVLLWFATTTDIRRTSSPYRLTRNIPGSTIILLHTHRL